MMPVWRFRLDGRGGLGFARRQEKTDGSEQHENGERAQCIHAVESGLQQNQNREAGAGNSIHIRMTRGSAVRVQRRAKVREESKRGLSSTGLRVGKKNYNVLPMKGNKRYPFRPEAAKKNCTAWRAVQLRE